MYQPSIQPCPQSTIRSSLAVGILGVFGMVLSVGLGCERKLDTAPGIQSGESSASAVSLIPLRVWVVAPIGDEQIWMRQWLAHSEQPLELRSLTIEDLLQQPQNECDVLLYPAKLIGELTQRGWIGKLPESVEAAGTDGRESVASSALGAWRQQSSYAGQIMAVPLGCALPVFIGSSVGPATEQPLSWETVLNELQLAERADPQLDVDASQVDREALVDRFLAIVATLSSRDPSYGLLFDLQTMQSRLGEENYVRAAKILAALAAQKDGLESVIGTHSAAWSWAATNQQAALAIAAPTLLDSDAAGISTGQIVRFQSSANRDERPKVVAWNSGGGLLASLSSQCRQSNQAGALLRWLAEPSTRGVLANFAVGIEAPTSSAGVDSLARKAQQSLSEFMSGVGVAQEPRLPQAIAYRAALADELIQFLSGKKKAQQALQDANGRWQAITEQAGPLQRLQYEHSLGLTL